jgi:sugar (pentulose or hexulose) kinase
MTLQAATNKGVISLDLGTSAFKCALIGATGELIGAPIIRPYAVQNANGRVTYPAVGDMALTFDRKGIG